MHVGTAADDRGGKDDNARPAGPPHAKVDGQTTDAGGAADEVQQAAGAGEGRWTMDTEADNTRRDSDDVLVITSHPVDRP